MRELDVERKGMLFAKHSKRTQWEWENNPKKTTKTAATTTRTTKCNGTLKNDSFIMVASRRIQLHSDNQRENYRITGKIKRKNKR